MKQKGCYIMIVGMWDSACDLMYRIVQIKCNYLRHVALLISGDRYIINWNSLIFERKKKICPWHIGMASPSTSSIEMHFVLEWPFNFTSMVVIYQQSKISFGKFWLISPLLSYSFESLDKFISTNWWHWPYWILLNANQSYVSIK